MEKNESTSKEQKILSDDSEASAKLDAEDPYKSQDANYSLSALSDPLKERQDYPPQTVTWSTVINGNPFRFAYFLSYFGLPIGCLLGLILLLMTLEYPSFFTVLSIISLVTSSIILSGLYRFKRYAYVLLMISYYGYLVIDLVLFIVFLGKGAAVYFVQMIVMAPFIIYFSKRSDAYRM